MTDPVSAPHRGSLKQAPLNVVRGGLIGLAEAVPGVSGGTVALVTGIYERALEAAGELGGAFAALLRGPDRWRNFSRRIAGVDWWLVIPVMIGMVIALLSAAHVVVDLIEAHPENARGLFFGLVAASIIVPFQMMPRRVGAGAGWVVVDVVTVLVPAAIAFTLITFSGGGTIDDPSLVAVFFAAAVAVCALLIPGVSGSFFLLAVGLYTPTLQALNDRNLTYIGVFMLGAVAGLLTIVKLLRYLLRAHRRTTLLAAAGLMVGSIRALWPWQGGEGSEDGAGALLAPTTVMPVVMAVIGAAVVIVLIILETRIQKRAAAG